MDEKEINTLKERFQKMYNFLVDETVNPMTYRNREKNQRLTDLLELCEYLQGTYEENPLDRWFYQD